MPLLPLLLSAMHLRVESLVTSRARSMFERLAKALRCEQQLEASTFRKRWPVRSRCTRNARRLGKFPYKHKAKQKQMDHRERAKPYAYAAEKRDLDIHHEWLAILPPDSPWLTTIKTTRTTTTTRRKAIRDKYRFPPFLKDAAYQMLTDRSSKNDLENNRVLAEYNLPDAPESSQKPLLLDAVEVSDSPEPIEGSRDLEAEEVRSCPDYEESQHESKSSKSLVKGVMQRWLAYNEQNKK
eukprot:gnl/TRDRNA2_/TRDRNA2_169095_c0_seq2.p1 gnl/TRDRNA2_/TRDRNA2_169095_c0~~gnl/TRDRNA2_/TRDRNA2_169095_c0_seq2.p1  ORF type:complete len:239 (-),score=36.22 gnl/TRDRNA2_/TRDRNA2_169095_c0_seq2:347-1063(-)